MNALIPLLAQEDPQGGSIFSLLILVLPLAALFYLMIVPQRKQRAKHQAFVSSLKVGDEVVTTGGIYGTINLIEDDVVHLEVDTDVVVRVSLGSLARSASEPETPAAPRRASSSRSAEQDEGDGAEERDGS